MDLFKSMQAFVATVRAGSMSAAAASLGLSPAMVGQHVAALEERLGTRLLNRTTRRQHLTDFGLSYFEQCRDILDRVGLAEEAAEAQQTQARGRLRVTAPTTFGAEALMPALAAYRTVAPDVELDIALTDRTVDLVEEGFDVAFRIGKLSDNRMIARALDPYRMVVCASPGYLLRNAAPTHPSELTSHETIAFAPSARMPWRFTDKHHEINISPPHMLTVDNGQALRSAALSGLGIIMQPEILVRRDLEKGALVQLLTDWRLGERPMSMVYYKDRLMTPRLRSFIEFSVSVFGRSAGRSIGFEARSRAHCLVDPDGTSAEPDAAFPPSD